MAVGALQGLDGVEVAGVARLKQWDEMPVKKLSCVDRVMGSSVIHAEVGPGVGVPLGKGEAPEEPQELLLAGGRAEHVGRLYESTADRSVQSHPKQIHVSHMISILNLPFTTLGTLWDH